MKTDNMREMENNGKPPVINKDLYQRVIQDFSKTNSVEQTAQNCNCARVTAQKILITEGLWSSKTSRAVAELLSRGKTVKEIAAELFITEKTVQTYLPYSRGMYGAETEDAYYSQDYRERMQTAAANMHMKAEHEEREESHKKKFIEEELKKQYTDDRSWEILNFTNEELNRYKANPGSQWNMRRKGGDHHSRIRSYHLKLELVPDLQWCDNLTQYLGGETAKKDFLKLAKSDQGIIREVVLPGDMNLHAFHYVIQQVFGWQNSHLHRFCLQEDRFNRLTAGRVGGYMDLCGTLFRCDSEDTDDLYWDDDYQPEMSVKTWMKRKYSWPFRHYAITDTRYQGKRYKMWFEKRYPEITRDMRVNILNREHFVEMICDDLMEGLRIDEIFTDEGCSSWSNSKLREWKKYILTETGYQDDQFLKLVTDAFEEEHAWSKNDLDADGINQLVEEGIKGLMDELKATRTSRNITEQKIWDDKQTGSNCGHKYIKEQIGCSAEQALRLLERQVKYLENCCVPFFEEYVVHPLAFTDELLYQYDFGDNWWVKITLVGIGDEIEPAKCIAADGLNLLDDCGGIRGFYDFLQCVYGDDPEEKESMKQWARGLGWTGRKKKPENIL